MWGNGCRWNWRKPGPVDVGIDPCDEAMDLLVIVESGHFAFGAIAHTAEQPPWVERHFFGDPQRFDDRFADPPEFRLTRTRLVFVKGAFHRRGTVVGSCRSTADALNLAVAHHGHDPDEDVGGIAELGDLFGHDAVVEALDPRTRRPVRPVDVRRCDVADPESGRYAPLDRLHHPLTAGHAVGPVEYSTAAPA